MNTKSSVMAMSVSRRAVLKATSAGMAVAGIGVPLSPSSSAARQDDMPQGGTLRVAIMGEPPAVVDSHFSTATITQNIGAQLFEGLFTFDAGFNPQPMLADTWEMSEDGKTFACTIRKGIKFHDGNEVKADDVVASLTRWGTINGRGKRIFGRMDSLEKTDDYSITMTFKEPTGILPSFLARDEAFIIPATAAETAGEDQLTEDQYIGTGPFKFEEHAIDQYLRLVRFEDYQPREEEADGAAGKRIAYLDAIEFIPVPDESVRANGVIAGDYHFGETLPPDFYDMLTTDPSLTPIEVKPYYWYAAVFNKQKGLFADPKARMAVHLAFKAADALKAGFGRDELIRVDPSVCGEETAWYSNAGTETFNTPDIEKAKALLKEAGYNGETVRWLATHEYAYNFKMADYIKQQLEAVGMKVELVISDWATLVENRANPDAYEVCITGFFQYSHPASQPYNDEAWPGFWVNEEKDSIVGDMMGAATDEDLKTAIDAYTELIYQDIPVAKIGDNFVLRAHRNEVKGYQNLSDWKFWNVALEQ